MGKHKKSRTKKNREKGAQKKSKDIQRVETNPSRELTLRQISILSEIDVSSSRPHSFTNNSNSKEVTKFAQGDDHSKYMLSLCSGDDKKNRRIRRFR